MPACVMHVFLHYPPWTTYLHLLRSYTPQADFCFFVTSGPRIFCSALGLWMGDGKLSGTWRHMDLR